LRLQRKLTQGPSPRIRGASTSSRSERSAAPRPSGEHRIAAHRDRPGKGRGLWPRSAPVEARPYGRRPQGNAGTRSEPPISTERTTNSGRRFRRRSAVQTIPRSVRPNRTDCCGCRRCRLASAQSPVSTRHFCCCRDDASGIPLTLVIDSASSAGLNLLRMVSPGRLQSAMFCLNSLIVSAGRAGAWSRRSPRCVGARAASSRLENRVLDRVDLGGMAARSDDRVLRHFDREDLFRLQERRHIRPASLELLAFGQDVLLRCIHDQRLGAAPAGDV